MDGSVSRVTGLLRTEKGDNREDREKQINNYTSLYDEKGADARKSNYTEVHSLFLSLLLLQTFLCLKHSLTHFLKLLHKRCIIDIHTYPLFCLHLFAHSHPHPFRLSFLRFPIFLSCLNSLLSILYQ